MSNTSKSSISGGISFASLLGLVFLVLKLCKVISWSWWWVTAPFWIPLAIGLVCGLLYLVLLVIDKK